LIDCVFTQKHAGSIGEQGPANGENVESTLLAQGYKPARQQGHVARQTKGRRRRGGRLLVIIRRSVLSGLDKLHGRGYASVTELRPQNKQ
jgi:hypothetical protein